MEPEVKGSDHSKSENINKTAPESADAETPQKCMADNCATHTDNVSRQGNQSCMLTH